jgi:hypothetical protein
MDNTSRVESINNMTLYYNTEIGKKYTTYYSVYGNGGKAIQFVEV